MAQFKLNARFPSKIQRYKWSILVISLPGFVWAFSKPVATFWSLRSKTFK